MPRRKRKHVITVEHWEPLRKHWLYRGRIRSVSLENAPDHLRVEILNLDPRELDRIHTVDLPLPVKPGNRTHALLVACGIDASAGVSVDLDQLVNRIVGFRLRDENAGDFEQFDFEPIEAAPVAEKRAPAADDSENGPLGDKDVEAHSADRAIRY